MLAGLAVGLTRGAYLGLAAGLIAYAGVILYRKQEPRRLLLPGSVAIGRSSSEIFVAPALAIVRSHPGPADRRDHSRLGQGACDRAVCPAGPPRSHPDRTAPGGPDPACHACHACPPAGGSKPPPVVEPPDTDTLAFRLARIPTALTDWQRDPVIGLGANSFGQRHIDLSQGPAVPDHLAHSAVAALYESGVVGFAGLTVGFACSAGSLARVQGRPATGPIAARPLPGAR